MKGKALLAVMLLLIAVCSGASGLIEAPKRCAQCSMDRETFAHSRVLITYADGTVAGLCSLFCAAELNSSGAPPPSFLIADYFSRELTDARGAVWVIGGDKSGVMTGVPKWAFADAKEARKFIAAHGGTLASFDRAFALSVQEVRQRRDEQRHVEEELVRELR